MADLVKDPVCGMDIDPKDAAATSDHEGVTYYFCAVGCKERFDADPAKFLGAGAPPPSMAAEPSREAAPPAASEPRKWWQFWRS